MTTGEYIVSLSGLSSGTALEHLLAIQARIGSGATFFTSRMSVLAGHDEISVEPCAVPVRRFAEGAKVAYPILTERQITLTQRTLSLSVEHRAADVVIKHRPQPTKLSKIKKGESA